jgi:hypothetical protein
MLTVLDGDPGLGKSTLTADFAARLSRGRPMPFAANAGEPAGVVILSAEDDLARTIRPRLEAADADLDRIATLALREPDGTTRAPLLTRADMRSVDTAIGDLQARLLILDPLVAYFPDALNANRDQDARRALGLLSDLAARTDCAVVVVRHLRKSPADSALYRGGGSIGIIAAARAGFLVALDPDDPAGARRVFAPTKMNVGPMPPALSFGLVTQLGSQHPRIAWDGPSTQTARVLLSAPDSDTARQKIEEAKDVLRAILDDGPVRARDGQRQAHEAGVAERTLDRARAELGVVARKSGRPGEPAHWEWELPSKDATVVRRTPSLQGGVLRPGMASFGPGPGGDVGPASGAGAAVEADYPRSAWDGDAELDEGPLTRSGASTDSTIGAPR